MVITPRPLTPPPSQEMKLFRMVTFVARTIRRPLMRSPSITVLSAVTVLPLVSVSTVPARYPVLRGPGHPHVSRFAHSWGPPVAQYSGCVSADADEPITTMAATKKSILVRPAHATRPSIGVVPQHRIAGGRARRSPAGHLGAPSAWRRTCRRRAGDRGTCTTCRAPSPSLRA